MAKASIPSPDTDPGRKRTPWETIVVTTPVILTVVATILAGLSSSEMSLAQYVRSVAAQMQSKVSDQWNYFQAKKLKAEQCRNSIEVLRGVCPMAPADGKELRETARRLVDEMARAKEAEAALPPATSGPSKIVLNPSRGDPSGAAGALYAQLDFPTTRPDAPGGADELAGFMRGDIPKVAAKPVGDQKILDAIGAIDSHLAESELERQAGGIAEEDMARAITIANENSAAFDARLASIQNTFSRIARSCAGFSQMASDFERTARPARDAAVSPTAAAAPAAIHELGTQLSVAASIAKMNFNANRYQREAGYNLTLGQLYEIQVRQQGFLSDRHRRRSKEFFYGMLCAQAGVTIATFSLALRYRSLLWGIAAGAGLAAITLAAYVYMCV